MNDLDTQLRNYAGYLDALPTTTHVSARGTTGRVWHPGWGLRLATAGLALAGVGAIVIAVYARQSGVAPAVSPTETAGAPAETGWTPVIDTSGVFVVAPSDQPVSHPSGDPAGDHEVDVAAVAVSDATTFAVGSEAVGVQTIGAIWKSTVSSGWVRLKTDPAVFGNRDGGVDSHGLPLDAVALAGIVDHGSRLVAVGNGRRAGQSYAWVSDDQGLTWQRSDLPASGAVVQMSGVTEQNGNVVAVGTDETTGVDGWKPVLWSSADGVTWSPLPFPTPTYSMAAGSPATLGRSIVVPESQCVNHDLACTAGPAVWTSTDAQTWTRVALPSPAGQGTVSSVVAGDGLFVAFGTEGHATDTVNHVTVDGGATIAIWTSADARTWTQREITGLSTGAAVREAFPIAAGTRGFRGFATETSGGIRTNLDLTSDNGITWTAQRSVLDGFVEAITRAPNGYIALAKPGPVNTTTFFTDPRSRNMTVWHLTTS
jgi:hypothetical protein